MRIQHNIMAMSAYRNYTNNVSAMKKNLEKLSSGYKINRAGDDAAGLAISEKMRAQITGLETAQKNAKDGISLVQTAEGALTEVHDMLNRMVELATQSANGTYDNDVDRLQMQKELNQLREEIDRIADSSNFNGIKLLDGSMSADEVNTKAFTIGTADDSAMRDASGVLGSIPTTLSASKTILHKAGASAQVGSFKLALDQISVGKATTGNSQLVIKISNAKGNTSATVTGTAAGSMDGKKIASEFAKTKGHYVIATQGGGLVFSSKKASANNNTYKNALVYTGVSDGKGNITYTLTSYTSSTGGTATAIPDDLNNLSASDASRLSGAASAKLNFNVTVSTVANKGGLTDNRNNKGAIDAKDTLLKSPETFGNTYMSFAASAVTDGMKFVLGTGTGTQKVTVEVQLSGSTARTAKSGELIVDLRKLVGSDGKITASNKREAMNKIAEKLTTNAAIAVGVDDAGTHFTLSEKTNGQGLSAASSANKDAMSKVGTFNKLLKVQAPPPAGAKNTTIKIDPASLKEGDSLTIDGTEYVFTKQTMADSSKVRYVKFASNATGATVAAALVAKVNSSKVAQGTPTDTVVLKGDTKLGSDGHNLVLQIGDTAEKFNQLDVAIKDMHVKAMGAGVKADGTMDYTTVNDISIATQSAAQAAVDVIKRAINYVSDMRGTLGATQNRLDHTMNNLSVMTENIQDAESTIRDVDIAEEMMAYTKNNILIQSAQAMLAQANQVPQGVLQLLQ